LKKIIGLGQPTDLTTSTSASGSIATLQPRLATPASSPGGSAPASVELQPRPEGEGRSDASGYGPTVAAVMTLNHLLVSEPTDTHTPILATANDVSSRFSLCDKLPVIQAGSSALCELQLVSEPTDPIFPPLSATGTFVPGLVGGCQLGAFSPSIPCYFSSSVLGMFLGVMVLLWLG
jgi:hypothetical protein